MSHKKNIVKKPWGYEYLAYENNECALWLLFIDKDQRTSMHCHPNKTTGLAVLEGGVVVSFLSDDCPMNPMNKIMIRKGLFHSTCATTDEGAYIFEIETPVDKSDLVRLRDKYGRKGKPYENSEFEHPKKDDCLWIKNPTEGEQNIYTIANSRLTVRTVKNVDFFNSVEDNINIVFLKGGIITEYGINVAGAGDIVSSTVIKELIQTFNRVKDETIIMIMEKNV